MNIRWDHSDVFWFSHLTMQPAVPGWLGHANQLSHLFNLKPNQRQIQLLLVLRRRGLLSHPGHIAIRQKPQTLGHDIVLAAIS